MYKIQIHVHGLLQRIKTLKTTVWQGRIQDLSEGGGARFFRNKKIHN